MALWRIVVKKTAATLLAKTNGNALKKAYSLRQDGITHTTNRRITRKNNASTVFLKQVRD